MKTIVLAADLQTVLFVEIGRLKTETSRYKTIDFTQLNEMLEKVTHDVLTQHLNNDKNKDSKHYIKRKGFYASDEYEDYDLFFKEKIRFQVYYKKWLIAFVKDIIKLSKKENRKVDFNELIKKLNNVDIKKRD